MALKKTTVMVDKDDLRVIREAAAREGRPESEYVREAVRIAALRARRWSGDWDIPEIGFGGPMSDDDVGAAVKKAEDRKDDSSGCAV